MLISRVIHRRARALVSLALMGSACLLAAPGLSPAFQGSDEEHSPRGGARPNQAAQANPAAEEDQVVVKREAVRLIDPRTYRASMQLRAVRSIDLTAPVDGTIRTVAAKPQQKVNSQAEVLRFDDARANLVLKRARAQHQAAQTEKKLVQAKGDADLVALAESKLEAAHAELEIAQLEAERLVIRSPFPGEVERIYVSEGQFVRAGDRLATVFDPSKLSVEVPAERSAAGAGKLLDIKVEESAVKAKVEAVLPLHPQFDALRELIVSPVSAIVLVENPDGKLSPGQTVYSELIPLSPLTLVPAAAIANAPNGARKLQVLRDNIVRDLTVRVMGKVGTDAVYVAGRFSEGDEVIVSTTRALTDGTALRALAQGAPSGAKSAPGGRTGAAPAGGKPASGF